MLQILFVIIILLLIFVFKSKNISWFGSSTTGSDEQNSKQQEHFQDNYYIMADAARDSGKYNSLPKIKTLPEVDPSSEAAETELGYRRTEQDSQGYTFTDNFLENQLHNKNKTWSPHNYDSKFTLASSDYVSGPYLEASHEQISPVYTTFRGEKIYLNQKQY